MQTFEGGSGKPRHEDRKYMKITTKYVAMKSHRTLTSMDSHPTLAQSDFTARSFAREESACNGNAPSRTELIGCPCEREYFTSLMFAAAKCRPK
jgi:hypothetical protein